MLKASQSTALPSDKARFLANNRKRRAQIERALIVSELALGVVAGAILAMTIAGAFL
jgi:hypothetical protein